MIVATTGQQYLTSSLFPTQSIYHCRVTNKILYPHLLGYCVIRKFKNYYASILCPNCDIIPPFTKSDCMNWLLHIQRSHLFSCFNTTNFNSFVSTSCNKVIRVRRNMPRSNSPCMDLLTMHEIKVSIKKTICSVF